MNFNKALKFGICLLAGAATGMAVFKTVKVGFSEFDEIKKKPESKPGNNGYRRNLSDNPLIIIPNFEGQKQQEAENNNQNQQLPNTVTKEPKPESKGEIVNKGLKSAVKACGMVTAAAQCVSEIADSISRVSALFKGQQVPQPGYGYGYGNPMNNYGCYSNQYQQGVNMGNGQVWYRVNPVLVDARLGNPNYYQCYNNYAI